MGLIDAFSAEDRVEITVSQLIKVLNERARAETNFNTAIAMIREGVPSDIICRVFNAKEMEENSND